MTYPSETSAPEKKPLNPSAVTALVLSIVGCIGWITLFSLLLPYESDNKTGAEPLFNLLAFGINSVLLLVGSAISGTLCFSGLLTGAVALGNASNRISYAAVLLGALGLLGGAVLIIWRFDVVFG